MDDTIAILNARNKPGPSTESPAVTSSMSPEKTVNISIISRDESNNDDDVINERPVSILPCYILLSSMSEI